MIYHPERLANVDRRLVDIVRQVGSVRDVLVVYGARTVEAEIEAIHTGHSSLRDPMHSKHVIGPARPLALALDLGPIPLVWTDIPAFAALAVDVKDAARKLSIPLSWGGDWTHAPKDYDHFELVEVP